MRKYKAAFKAIKPPTPTVAELVDQCAKALADLDNLRRIAMLARLAKADYNAYLAAGFSDTQALYLTGQKHAK